MLGLIPLYYQLLSAYRPADYQPASIPTPQTQILGVSTILPTPTTKQLPAIGGEGQVITVALLGDSMIDTLKLTILEKSLNHYFPKTKFNLLNYGYGATKINSAMDRLLHQTQYLNTTLDSIISQNPQIIVIESFAYNNFGNTPEGINLQTSTLTDLTTVIRQKLPATKIVLAASISPNSLVFGKGNTTQFTALEKVEKSSTIRLYLQNLTDFAASKNYPLADAYHPSFIDGQGYLPLVSSDGIHPSEFGSEFFGDILAKSFVDNRLIP